MFYQVVNNTSRASDLTKMIHTVFMPTIPDSLLPGMTQVWVTAAI